MVRANPNAIITVIGNSTSKLLDSLETVENSERDTYK